MAYPSCSPPRGQSVKPHTRSKPRLGDLRAANRRRKASKAKAAAKVYWTCVAHGGTCGVHHRTAYAASNHQRRLNLEAYRRNRTRPWNVEKRGPKK